MINRSAARAMQQSASMFQQAAAAGKQVAKGVTKVVQKGAGAATDAGGSALEKAAKVAKSGAQDPAGFATDTAQGVMKGVASGAQTAASGVAKGIGGMAKTVLKGVGQASGAVGDMAQAGMSAAEKGAEMANPAGAVTKAVKTIYSVGQFGMSKAGQAVALGAGAAGAGQQAGSSAASWAAGAASKAAGAASNAASQSTEFLSDVAHAWNSAADEAAQQAFGAFSMPVMPGSVAGTVGAGGASASEGPDVSGWTEEALSAAADAIGLWKLQLKITNSKIMAVSLIVSPGGFSSSFNIRSYIKTTMMAHGIAQDAADAYGKTVHDLWETWEDGLSVPGLPCYPAFAAWPGPEAPPMPNIPFPLISCPSTGVSSLMNPSAIKDKLVSNLDSGIPYDVRRSLGDAFGSAFATAFGVWIASSQVTMVLGKGPVPTFAPPYVPVGPVVMGSVLPTPGILASAPEFGGGLF